MIVLLVVGVTLSAIILALTLNADVGAGFVLAGTIELPTFHLQIAMRGLPCQRAAECGAKGIE